MHNAYAQFSGNREISESHCLWLMCKKTDRVMPERGWRGQQKHSIIEHSAHAQLVLIANQQVRESLVMCEERYRVTV